MRTLAYRQSPAMIAGLLALASAACVPSASLNAHQCPCVTGWVCCPSTNLCVQEGTACELTGGAGGGFAAGGGGRGGMAGGGMAGGGGAVTVTDAGTPHGDALRSPAETYLLVQTKNIASPLPDPSGLAYDGNGLWILNGGQNSLTNTLVHFDPTTGKTDRTFTFSNLIEQLGSGAYGITWDGSAVWISVSGNTNKLVRVDPTTGQITRTISSPTDLGPSDLDFDGTSLWLSSGTGTAFVIDPASGGIQRHFNIAGYSASRDNGIAVRPGEVWVGGLFGGIAVNDPTTGQPIALATHDDGSAFRREELGSSCFVGAQLVIASRYGITYFLPKLGNAHDGGANPGDGGIVCPAVDHDAACPASDHQCRATWADVLANPICVPQTVDKSQEARFDCNGYHVSLIAHVDSSSTYYYDALTGQLIAVYANSIGGQRCVMGPPSGVKADCPTVTPVQVCRQDGGA
ncbi:MAG: hypothetical protein ACJ8F1_03785 [Polyangia bacterium]